MTVDTDDVVEAYRAVVTRSRQGVGDVVIYSRCYDKPGPAKAFVTRERRSNYNGKFVDGWVEFAATWRRLED